MTNPVSKIRSLLPALDNALQSFISSSASFKVIRTIPSRSEETSSTAKTETDLPFHPKTLLILDSSYNPPSRAHLALASTAIAATKGPGPIRLLFLFSTHNADKAPSPASFSQRLAMMILLAEDPHTQTRALSSSSSSSSSSASRPDDVSIDIGLTTAPYYTDKSAAIVNAQPTPYPSKPRHVHILGYDTLIRFLAPKYYPKHSPPLSALAPYFDAGHRLLVVLRPDSSSDNAVSADTESEQRSYISNLSKGSLKADGLEDAWAAQISILEGNAVDQVKGISSTSIRRAANRADWDTVNTLCSGHVAAWIQDQQLYSEDGRDARAA